MIPAAEPREQTTRDYRPVAILFAALIVLGVVLGVVWELWSPPGPRGGVLTAGIQADETESFAAADGRYALLTGVLGILAGIAAWYLRRHRGPVVAAALALGGVGGGLLTVLVGHLIRGTGSTYRCGTETGKCIDHLPLWVQMHGLWFLEAALAVLVYSIFVAFAADDDLGRPDPARDARLARRSVGPQSDVQHPGPYGDAAGPPQQHEFPAQYPHQPLHPPGGGELAEQ